VLIFARAQIEQSSEGTYYACYNKPKGWYTDMAHEYICML